MQYFFWLTRTGLLALLVIILCSNFTERTNSIAASVFVNGESFMSYRQQVLASQLPNHQRRVGEYYDANGKLAVRSEVIYNQSTAMLYSYKMEDHRTNYTECILLKGDQYVLSKKTNGATQAEEKSIAAQGSKVHGSFIDLFLLKNLSQLQQGKTITFDLMLPIHLRAIEFRLQKRDDEVIDGTTYEVVSMEPSNFIFRKMVDPSYFYLSKTKPQQLIRYHGRLLPANDQGKGVSGIMVYGNKSNQ